ncbi:hypothetical protein CYMTET_13831 [Cymbomonas tetramitiformis]|uniref:Uncharacterized protein n=1 Tax=Cymbomonas tetramitiformis TaxID=36881 RepID=A0AAE0GHQ9_9CHLO|nr:hypothetical protein CYMTET_13831 [Cymbomonas tetramitiformis]
MTMYRLASPSCVVARNADQRQQVPRRHSTTTRTPFAKPCILRPQFQSSVKMLRPARRPVRVTKTSTRGSKIVALFDSESLPSLFTGFNTAVLIPWVAMIFAPRARLTQTVMKSEWSQVIPCLIFTYFFVTAAVIDAAAGEDLATKVQFLFTEAIADPDKMASMFVASPSYAAQDWVHLCTWDLIVGRMIYLDGLAKGLPTWHSLTFCFNSGPPGLLIHILTKGIVGLVEEAKSTAADLTED